MGCGSSSLEEEILPGKPEDNPVVYFDIEIGGKPAGRIEMTLRADVVPKTAEVRPIHRYHYQIIVIFPTLVCMRSSELPVPLYRRKGRWKAWISSLFQRIEIPPGNPWLHVSGAYLLNPKRDLHANRHGEISLQSVMLY
jgi:hypothetical protein